MKALHFLITRNSSHHVSIPHYFLYVEGAHKELEHKLSVADTEQYDFDPRKDNNNYFLIDVAVKEIKASRIV